MARSWTSPIIPIQITMIVVIIVGGMLIGYGIGMYIVDGWINQGNKDINGEN